MLTPLLALPQGFPFAFCGFLLDTPTLAVVPSLGSGCVTQGQGMLFVFANPSGATRGLLASGAQGMLTYPVSDTGLYASLVSVQSVQVGPMFFALCTTLTTTPDLRTGRFFARV